MSDKDIDRYIFRRNGRFHYRRRVPVNVIALGEKTFLQKTLKTKSIETARLRRDELERVDDEYWASLSSADGGARSKAVTNYARAQATALSKGFIYKSSSELASGADIDEILERIAALERSGFPSKNDVISLLGAAAMPPTSLKQAFDVYVNDIKAEENRTKSAGQIASWRKVKWRAVKNFIKVVGDKNIDDITRDDAILFYKWWSSRVRGAGKNKPLSGNSANRDVGNLRALYRDYFVYLGQRDRKNPFQDLSFSDPKVLKRDVPPFPDGWIENQLLVPGAYSSLNRDAALIVLSLIETGCRPSEICNIVSECICLNDEVPHIKIRYRKDRAIKTDSSQRDIPLVGVSLLAMSRASGGFDRYIDKENTLSNTLLKYFRARKLFPSADHVIYSFRHSFEKRMLQANIDYGLRCTLMGHAIDRPEYGDGGSLSYRRDQMLKFALPVTRNMKLFVENL